MLDHAAIQARLTLPPDQEITHPESGMVRTLYECPDQPLDTSGKKRYRVVGATHPAGATKSRIGVTRDGVVSELFVTTLSSAAFPAADVVALSLHRGSCETALADEDQEHDPDRWCSQAAWGQEAWQIISQWVWKLRLELGHQVHPDPVRTTECAPGQEKKPSSSLPPQGSAPASPALPWKADHFSGCDVPLQPDGTLRCPAGQSFVLHERRPEANGSRRMVSAASIRRCRPCPVREPCQWNGSATITPRQVSILLHPLAIGSAPILWRDGSRRLSRRACIQVVRSQRQEVEVHPSLTPPPDSSPCALSRAQRAHSRLTFQERLARHGRTSVASQVTITLFGVPDAFAAVLGLRIASRSSIWSRAVLSSQTGFLL